MPTITVTVVGDDLTQKAAERRFRLLADLRGYELTGDVTWTGVNGSTWRGKAPARRVAKLELVTGDRIPTDPTWAESVREHARQILRGLHDHAELQALRRWQIEHPTAWEERAA